MLKIIADKIACDFKVDIWELCRAFYEGEEVEIFMEGEDCELTPEDHIMNFDTKGLELSGNRKTDKILIKAKLYRELFNETRRTLPWGSLTGIRPVTIYTEALEKNGWNTEIADKILKDEYLISEEKKNLIKEVAIREKSVLDSIEKKSGKNYKDGWSLYIGVPFCPSRCLYCSFTSNDISLWEEKLPTYFACFEKELTYVLSAMKDKYLQSIYIGGGTPTALSAKYLDILMDIIYKHCPMDHLCEFTVEAGRPDSIDMDKLSILKSADVTRISINPQTFNEDTLKLIGRKHTVSDVYKAYDMARSLDFNNINMDIILGLPGEHIEDLLRTLKSVEELRPESLTVHSLAIKRAARLTLEKDHWAGVYRAGNDLPEIRKMMHESENCAKRLGLNPYYLYRQKNMAGNLENTGYSKDGLECLYNILMMGEKHTVIGCGAGCSSKIVYPGGRIERCDNGKSIRNYILNIDTMIERKQKALSK